MSCIRYGAIAVGLAGITAGVVMPASATAAEVAPGALMVLGEENPSHDLPVEVPPEFDVVGRCSQGLPGTVTLPDGSQRRT
ncbi:hypothetical protein [Corynebacterium oculi]|uniref:Secreted protein n=1 Tax=Corynebacterium oculi TaxID=1544416 RepID=A0A0Q0U0Z4_9CORY|nr:hypothetical protein [Corynebacterium oculi]KQB85360.1 hypothetical protein Cocul_00499 [Corynebacterium oculi]